MADSGRRVLVVDDDQAIRGIVCEVLSDEGYQVKTATNGREALAVVGRWEPNLILLDLMMPVMNGWMFVEACRREGVCEQVPIMLMSAGQRASAVTELEAEDFLAKPFDIDQLLQKVEHLAG